MPENPEEIRPGGPRRQNPIRTVPDEPQKRTRTLLSSVVSTRRCCRRGGAQGQGARIPTRQPFDLEIALPRGLLRVQGECPAANTGKSEERRHAQHPRRVAERRVGLETVRLGHPVSLPQRGRHLAFIKAMSSVE